MVVYQFISQSTICFNSLIGLSLFEWQLQAHAVKKERSKIEQRPPFMKPREEINQELSRDPEIAPVMTLNLLFIDISSYTRPETANKVYT